MATAYLRRAEKGKSGFTVNMQCPASSVDLVFPIGLLASPLRPRHMFTGHCKYEAMMLQLSLGGPGASISAMFLACRIFVVAPRPSLRGPSADEAGATIHCKYEAILARRRLKRGRPRVDPLGPPGRPSSFFGPRCPPPWPSRKNSWRRGWISTSTHLTSLCHDTL